MTVFIKKKNSTYYQTYYRIKERFFDNTTWFPYPYLFSFSLCILLSAHILKEQNPRIGNPAQTIVLHGEKQQEGAIWLSVSINKNKLYITTHNKKSYFLPLEIKKTDELKPLSSFLKKQIVELSLSAGLAKSISKTQTLVVIAVDQGLRYSHIKPLLMALAQAGITEYAFETVEPETEQSKV